MLQGRRTVYAPLRSSPNRRHRRLATLHPHHRPRSVGGPSWFSPPKLAYARGTRLALQKGFYLMRCAQVYVSFCFYNLDP